MNIITVDEKKCTGCGECVRECPAGLFSRPGKENSKQAVFADPWGSCIACGHCLAVCPVDAILYNASDSICSFDAARPTIQDYHVLKNFLARRRSIRRFKDKAVSPADLEAIFTAMQHAPSATNSRRWEFIVIQDPGLRARLTGETIKQFQLIQGLTRFAWLLAPLLPRELKKMLKRPSIREGLASTLERYRRGEDVVLFNAPCVIILHSPRYGHLAGNDAGIILTQGMLAAESLGLGSCWIGFLQETFRLNKKLGRHLGIPRHHRVEGVLALGHPAVRFHNVPPRAPLKVRYF